MCVYIIPLFLLFIMITIVSIDGTSIIIVIIISITEFTQGIPAAGFPVAPGRLSCLLWKMSQIGS